jgi:hypothetical membrane protein
MQDRKIWAKLYEMFRGFGKLISYINYWKNVFFKTVNVAASGFLRKNNFSNSHFHQGFQKKKTYKMVIVGIFKANKKVHVFVTSFCFFFKTSKRMLHSRGFNCHDFVFLAILGKISKFQNHASRIRR